MYTLTLNYPLFLRLTPIIVGLSPILIGFLRVKVYMFHHVSMFLDAVVHFFTHLDGVDDAVVAGLSALVPQAPSCQLFLGRSFAGQAETKEHPRRDQWRPTRTHHPDPRHSIHLRLGLPDRSLLAARFFGNPVFKPICFFLLRWIIMDYPIFRDAYLISQLLSSEV